MLTWFNSLVTAAVLIILIIAAGESVMGGKSDLLTLAFSVFLLLMLPVLYKIAGRKPGRSK